MATLKGEPTAPIQLGQRAHAAGSLVSERGRQQVGRRANKASHLPPRLDPRGESHADNNNGGPSLAPWARRSARPQGLFSTTGGQGPGASNGPLSRAPV